MFRTFMSLGENCSYTMESAQIEELLLCKLPSLTEFLEILGIILSEGTKKV